MIHIYDGNNVRLREMTKPKVPGEARLSLRQQYEFHLSPGDDFHIWVWDGRDHNQRRRDLFPGYKAQREPMAEDHFSQIRLFRELLTYSRAVQFDVDGWEADDVIATLARHFAKDQPVTCHSNDLDYYQLCANPNIAINGIGKTPTEPRWIPLYKAFVGDTSDNIPGVAGFGPKTWDQMTPHREAMEKAIVDNDLPALLCLPFPQRVITQLMKDDALELLRASLCITHMFTVPFSELEAGTILPTPNPQAAHQLLDRYFL